MKFPKGKYAAESLQKYAKGENMLQTYETKNDTAITFHQQAAHTHTVKHLQTHTHTYGILRLPRLTALAHGVGLEAK